MKGYCKNIIAAAFLLLLVSCGERPSYHLVSPSFYHWQSELKLSGAEQNLLKGLRVTHLYLRYFDLDLDAAANEIIPLAPLQSSGPLPVGMEVIPVIFITNRAMLNCGADCLPELSRRMAARIREISKQLHLETPAELQLDCDWTPRSKDNFFQLLRLLRTEFAEEQLSLSATIRLHQIKFPKETGVPPVDRGMLMFYNMGDLENPATENSIFDWETAKSYTATLPDYPLPLDLALPVFRWGVLFRDGKMIRLINNLEKTDLGDNTRFKALDDHRYEVVKSTYLQGYYLYRGDRIRLEKVEALALEKAAENLSGLISNEDLRLAFYHLDAATIKNYTHEKLQKIIQALAGK